jgi:hypothetical protein
MFKVNSEKPDGKGGKEQVALPSVRKAHLREAGNRRRVSVAESVLMIEVPKQDPLRAVLCLPGQAITHHFGRVSVSKQELLFQVSKDRSSVTANVSHSVLAHFVSGEVRAAESEMLPSRRLWSFQLGPFAEHTVEIQKKCESEKVVTLLVDGTVLVEASARDIGCKSAEWRCSFQLVGERVIDFEVFRTNKDGSPLAETDHVKDRRKYFHECVVVIPNDEDFRAATLTIDGDNFVDLQVKEEHQQEQALSTEPKALMQTYGIATPYKVVLNAPRTVLPTCAPIAPRRTVGLGTEASFLPAPWCSAALCVGDSGDEMTI